MSGLSKTLPRSTLPQTECLPPTHCLPFCPFLGTLCLPCQGLLHPPAPMGTSAFQQRQSSQTWAGPEEG